jgi:2-amino-4-hydroxy-6-hydroxymethyldihydropteridine diphosphokinase
LNESASYVSLGSNLGNREANVFRALRLLQTEGAATVCACSGLYETEPVGVTDGGYFINAVAEVRPLLCPADLLNRLKIIETKMGRTSGHNRPRTIDIDIVSLGATILKTTDLTLPHPRYADRAFVLLPLREIVPDYVCPLSGRSIDDLIDTLDADHGVVRVSGRDIITTAAP